MHLPAHRRASISGLVFAFGMMWSLPLYGRLSGFFASPSGVSEGSMVLLVQVLAIAGLILLRGRLARVLLLSVVGFHGSAAVPVATCTRRRVYPTPG